MPYDPKAENISHVKRIATKLVDFEGRSQRSEFVVYVILVMVAGALISILNGLVSGEFEVRYSQYIWLAFWVPAIPLFARRLHDQNRSAWLALIVPVLLALNLYEQILFDAGQLPIPNFGFPLNLVEGFLVIAFWVLVFWPGTSGENRFGPDPRLEPVMDVG